VLPWGATEAHNFSPSLRHRQHPVEDLARRAAERAWQRGAKVSCYRACRLGEYGQLDIPLCINMNPSTQALLLRDLSRCRSRAGDGKLVIFNGHGAKK